MIIILIALQAGQIAKFDDRKPTAAYVTTARLEDVERCLIRVGAPPQVYRQPDRPDEVSIVWTAPGVSAGNAAARVDLKRTGTATTVTAWHSASIVASCTGRK